MTGGFGQPDKGFVIESEIITSRHLIGEIFKLLCYKRVTHSS